MKKVICWMIATLFLFAVGCSSEQEGATQQGDMFDALANGNTQSAANNEIASAQQRSRTVTVDEETTTCFDYVYDVQKDGTVRIDQVYAKIYEWTIPERIDGYTVSTLGRNMLSEALPISAQITIPDCVTKLEGNPFDCPGLTGSRVSKIIVSQTHPTLEVVDGVLFSKPDHRLVCACGYIGSEGYYIPEGTLTIEDHAFYNCVLNGTIHIPDSVTTIGKNPFAFCNRSIDQGYLLISVSENHPTLEIVNNMLYSKPDHRLICIADRRTEIVQYNVPTGTEIIDDYAFYRCGKLEYISIPASVKEIGINPFLFLTLANLNEVALDPENRIFEIEDGLLYDNAQKLLISCIDNTVQDRVVRDGTEMIGAYAFASNGSNASSDQSWHISVPNSVQEVGDCAFYGNKGMTTDIPPTLRTIGVCAYADCRSMNNELMFGGGAVIKEGAFSDYSGGGNAPNITGLTIIGDGGVTIGTGAFFRCSSLKNVSISKGESYIGSNAFWGCGLMEVNLSEGLVSIGDGAFMDCGNLYGSKLVLPASLEYIGDICNDSETVYDEKMDSYIKTNTCTMDVYVTAGSYAEQYCKENGISYQYSN